MITTFTLVKMQKGYDRESFYQRWCEHTRDMDLRDHPDISLNRLMLFEQAEGEQYIGSAENHWPNRAALDAAVAWYETAEGIEHMKDLASFMDVENSPTRIVSHEVEVSDEKGIDWKYRELSQ